MIYSFLQKSLIAVARLYVWRHKPTIVAVTGSVGKTSAKEAIACVLKRRMPVRMNGGNLNNELGVPLTILGDWTERYYAQGGTVGFWFRVAVSGLWGLLASANYPKVLVLEYAADRPGDIEKLVRWFKPHISVVTAIGEIPVHVEYFSGPEALAREKSQLVRALGPDDYAVLNADDPVVSVMRENTRAHIRTFGSDGLANIRISGFETVIDESGIPQGVSFKLHDDGSFVPVRMHGSLGRSQAYAAMAAAAVAGIFKINLVDISSALVNYVGPKGRLKLLPGIKHTTIIDDTYNASPDATLLALETLEQIPARRRIAVLGDMRELGRYAIQAHQHVGDRAGRVAQVLVCVGEKAKFIADAAANEMPQENIITFHTSDDAKSTVQGLIREGDVVLVKGSQGMRMEKIVEEIMAEPERKTELLVRQSRTWQNG